MLSLRNESLMDRTGKKSDAVPTDLVTEVLAGHADPGGVGGFQDIDIQVVPLLSGNGINSGHRSQASTSVLLATDSRGQGKSKTAMSVSAWWIVSSSCSKTSRTLGESPGRWGDNNLRSLQAKQMTLIMLELVEHVFT